MLTVQNSCFNAKCGEIYYLGCSNFYVNCYFCELKILFENFPEHYERRHLASASMKTSTKCQQNVETEEAIDIELYEDEAENATKDDMSYEVVFTTTNADVWQSGKSEKCADSEVKLPEAAQADDIVDANDNDDDVYDTNDNANDDDDANDASYSPANSNSSFESIEQKTTTAAAAAEVSQTFACPKCARTYPSKIQLRRHAYDCQRLPTKRTYKKPPTFACDECDEKFRSERLLEYHKYKHTGIFCEICGKQFKNLGNLRGHRLIHNASKTFQCDQCDMAFINEKRLLLHKKRHTENYRVICELCGKRFFEACNLRQHMLRHTGERPAKCEICHKRFFCTHDLNVHLVTHSDERPFKCDICQATFRLKKSLRVHKKKHYNRPLNHPCQRCNKAFADEKGLIAHMRSHDAANYNVTLLT